MELGRPGDARGVHSPREVACPSWVVVRNRIRQQPISFVLCLPHLLGRHAQVAERVAYALG